MVLQPSSGITASLGSVAYFYEPVRIYLILYQTSCHRLSPDPPPTYLYLRFICPPGHFPYPSLPFPSIICHYIRFLLSIPVPHLLRGLLHSGPLNLLRRLFFHRGILRRSPPLKPFSCAHTSKISCISTHCATVSCLWKMYVSYVCIPS